MRRRSVVSIILLSLVTFGIYGLYWLVSTKNELNQLGASIPTAWLLLVPFVNIWWVWKYAEGVEEASRGRLSGATSFLLLWLLGAIGMFIMQAQYNKLGEADALPVARLA